EVGVTWVDAPVSGGSEGAEKGTLAIMAGGKSDALETVRPYLDAYAKSIVHVGEEPGSGQTAKAVNQVLVVINALAVSEALLLADASGLDLHTTLSAVEGGAAGSWMLSNRGPQMIERDWRPGFTIDPQLKDLRIALETADRLGVPMPGLSLAFQLYRALQNRGLGHEGHHAPVPAIEHMAGLELRSAESVGLDPGGVAWRLVVPVLLDYRAVLVDDEGRPDQTLGDLAVQLLLAVGAQPAGEGEVLVGEEIEVETLLLLELLVPGGLVGADPDDGVAGPLELVVGVAEVARLGGAAGGHRPRVEEHHVLATGEVVVGDGLAVLVGEAEFDSHLPEATARPGQPARVSG